MFGGAYASLSGHGGKGATGISDSNIPCLSDCYHCIKKRYAGFQGRPVALVQTCRNLGINPQEYLEDVLRRIMRHPAKRIDSLLPVN